jgi:putative ABC transport system ATP-binding protein
LSYLIKLENVTKTYQIGDNHINALFDVDLTIKQGEMTAVMGSSGSGKSTLMNIIGCLDRVTTGKYYFANQDVSHLSSLQLAEFRNRKIGFVFQSFFLLPRVNALHNVILPLYYRGTPNDEAKDKALSMLAKVGMEQFALHKPNQLSGGQQQRVAIARALANDPEVVLADEPTGALDSQTGNEVLDLFDDLNRKEGRTIVIITHDHEVSRRCRRIVTIKDGRIMA